MGLRSFARRKLIEHIGSEFMKSGGDLVDWIKAHKQQIGWLFAVVWGWAFAQHCPVVWGVDVSKVLHLECERLVNLLGMVGSFLVGAGILKSDRFYKDKLAAEKEDEDNQLIVPPYDR